MPIGFMRHSSSFLMETSDPTIEAEVELPPIIRKPTSWGLNIYLFRVIHNYLYDRKFNVLAFPLLFGLISTSW